MCIRDRLQSAKIVAGYAMVHETTPEGQPVEQKINAKHNACLLYTSDAADERSSVDLGGRRIIKKKKQTRQRREDNT